MAKKLEEGQVHAKGGDEEACEQWLQETRHWVAEAFGENSSKDTDFFSAGQPSIVSSFDDGPSSPGEALRSEVKGKLVMLRSFVSILDQQSSLSEPSSVPASGPERPPVSAPLAPAEAPKSKRPDIPTARKPTAFIGSSVEGLEVARAIQLELQHEVNATVWSQGVFGLSEGSLEALVAATDRYDFAILVLTPDDLTTKREGTKNSPRDNVVFELGLFIGAIGRERTYIVRSAAPMELPSDLAGVTPAKYFPDHELPAAVGAACTQIRQAIRRVLSASAPASPARASFTDGFNPPLTVAAAEIAEARGKAWELRLLSQVLADEFRGIADRHRDLESGLADARVLSFATDAEAAGWMARQFRLIQRVPKNVGALFAAELPAAMGATGTPGDPQALVRVARRLAQEYSGVVEWGHDWRCLDIEETFARLVELGPTAAVHVAEGFRTWEKLLRDTAVGAAADEIPDGSRVQLTLTLSLPDDYAARMQAEIDGLNI